MAQLQKGTTYATGASVTATNLNAHVDSATLLAGAVTDQTAKAIPLAEDSVLIHSSADAALRKSTLAEVAANITVANATKLVTPRNIALTGSVTGNVNFDGSANVSITTSGGATITSISDQANSSTGYLDLPVGTTAQRPATPDSGNSRYNTTLAALEYYTGSAWESPATAASTLTQFNASGSAPVYACRAWVNFNGQGTVAIRASGNVSSITDNGTGDYTVNFTTAMSDANYAVATAGHSDAENTYNRNAHVRGSTTTSSVRIYTDNYAGMTDVKYVFVAIFR